LVCEGNTECTLQPIMQTKLFLFLVSRDLNIFTPILLPQLLQHYSSVIMTQVVLKRLKIKNEQNFVFYFIFILKQKLFPVIGRNFG